MIVVHAYPRLHLTLLDLAGCSLRKYGGAGLSLNALPVVVEANRANSPSLTGTRFLDARGQEDLQGAFARISALMQGTAVHVNVQSSPPQHVGLGTKTSLVLGVLKAAQLAADAKLDDRRLQELSFRGGTSGVGINAFFTGGFLTDGGHPYDQKSFRPSSASRPTSIPPVICQMQIPTKWNFYLALPFGKRQSGTKEMDFFSKNTPLPEIEAFNAIALIYQGVAPAIKMSDLKLMIASLRRLHRTGFKKRELARQSEETQRLYRSFDELSGCAAGMSSMGPLVYAIYEEGNTATSDALFRICEEAGAQTLAVCSGRNSGYEVGVDASE